MSPEDSLEEADLVPYKAYKNSIALPVRTDIVSFNYTHTLEKLLGKGFPVSLGNNVVSRPRHIHGVVDDSILMGVNDISQISNVSFRENVDLMDIVVKPSANDAMRNLSNNEVERMINETNLIVLYGLSLGETDRKWWQCIGKQFSRDDFRLMYCYVNKDVLPPRRRELTLRVYRECVREIIDKFYIPEELRSQVEKKTFISVNKPLFGMI